MSMRQQLPERARALVMAVIVAGAAVVASQIPAALRWTGRDLMIWAGLAVAGSVVEQFLLELQHRTERQFFSLTDALWVGGLMLTRPSILILAVAAGILAGQAVRRVAAYKVAFNVGQYLLSVATAALVYRAFRPVGVEPRAWFAAVAAMASYFVVNASAVALVISLVLGKPFRQVLARPLTLTVLQWAGNLAMGILGAVVWSTYPAALPLAVMPMVVSYLAYQGSLRGMRERDRSRALYEAGQSLIAPLAERGWDFAPLLSTVEKMLEAPAAALVLVEPGGVAVHDRAGATSLTAQSEGGGLPRPPEAYVPVRPGLVPHIAPIGPNGDDGALVVYRSEPLKDAERSLLDSVASQVRARLQNVRLFFETVRQGRELEEIITSTSDGIFTVSLAGRILSWNPAMASITGFSTTEAVGATWEEIFGPEDRPPEGELPGLGGAEVRNVQFVRKDRIPRWIRCTWNPVQGEGDVKAHVVVARDITAEIEAERLKADFVATVSHELRTPLTPLRGFLQSLVAGTVEDSPEARQEYYGIMLNQANRLERLVTDLLEVSRIESVGADVTSQVVDLNALMRDQVQEARAQYRGREISLTLPGTPVLVGADPFRIGQVVSNFVSNAIKYSPDAEPVAVTVGLDEGQAVVSVRDRGAGIPPGEREKVFERFHRVENGLTRRTGGAGLGLYIAKKLVEAMSGRVVLDSGPDGSTFAFSLPLVSLHAGREGNGHGYLDPAAIQAQ